MAYTVLTSLSLKIWVEEVVMVLSSRKTVLRSTTVLRLDGTVKHNKLNGGRWIGNMKTHWTNCYHLASCKKEAFKYLNLESSFMFSRFWNHYLKRTWILFEWIITYKKYSMQLSIITLAIYLMLQGHSIQRMFWNVAVEKYSMKICSSNLVMWFHLIYS